MIGGIGLGGSIMEHSSGITTMGSNLRLYTTGWRGNQYVSTLKLAETGKIIGISALGVGTALDLWGVRNYYRYGANSPNAVSPAKAGSDFGVGAWGLINPYTAVAAGFYFAVDALYPGGFKGAMQFSSELEQKNRAILGQGWNLYRDH